MHSVSSLLLDFGLQITIDLITVNSRITATVASITNCRHDAPDRRSSRVSIATLDIPSRRPLAELCFPSLQPCQGRAEGAPPPAGMPLDRAEGSEEVHARGRRRRASRSEIAQVRAAASGRPQGIDPMRYAVLIEKGERNYSGYVPDLPGCVSIGDTLDEVKAEAFLLEAFLL